MDSLKIKIKEDLKNAMKKGEATAVSVLRLLLASVANKEIELGKKEAGLNDEEVMNALRAEAKKRRDAIDGFEKAGRPELASQEKNELAILESYLPPEISDEEILAAVKKGIEESLGRRPTGEAGAASQADFGKAMKIIAPLLKGKASGSRIADILRKELETGK